jgi:cystathionine beta-lyase/cystathionine gamma-synthase
MAPRTTALDYRSNTPELHSTSAQEMTDAGVADGLVRISVGIEHWRDLPADFEQPLALAG